MEAVFAEDGAAFGEGDGAGKDGAGVYEGMKLAVLPAGVHVVGQRIEKVLVELPADEAAIEQLGIDASNNGLETILDKTSGQLPSSSP